MPVEVLVAVDLDYFEENIDLANSILPFLLPMKVFQPHVPSRRLPFGGIVWKCRNAVPIQKL